MSFSPRLVFLAAAVAVTPGFAQGTFVFDQQSADDNTADEGALSIQPFQPMGQSFIPSLSGVDFVRLWTFDSAANGMGATLYVNLRSGSINGPILGSTSPVFLPDGFNGRTNFLFSNQLALNPGDTYYLQPEVQSGDLWRLMTGTHFNYPGGMLFAQSSPSPAFDIWFREGIIIPEPCTASLTLAGLCAALYRMNCVRSKSKR